MTKYFLKMVNNEEIVKEIAARLGETEDIPLWQLTKIVQRNGAHYAYFMVESAEEIHREGLMMVADGSRLRTLGGVFFNIVRAGVSSRLRNEIFPAQSVKEKLIKYDRFLKTLPVFNWEKRITDLTPLFNQPAGEVKNVHIVLRGNPKHIEMRQELVVFRMTFDPNQLDFPLPRGLPPVPTEPTPYIVYVTMRQWKKNIAKSVANGQAILVDGTGVLDPVLQAIVVYARGVRVLGEGATLAQSNIDDIADQPSSTSIVDDDDASEATPPFHIAEPFVDEAVVPAQTSRPVVPLTAEEAHLAQFTPDLAAKLRPLYSARKMFEKRYHDIMAKPENERSGLQVAKMMLERTQQQIALLEGTNQ